MEKSLEAKIIRRVYDLIRPRTKGYIKVEITKDALDVNVTWRGFEYGTLYENLSSAIVNGNFRCEKIADQFVAEWRQYIHSQIEEIVFYNTSRFYGNEEGESPKNTIGFEGN